MPRVALPEDLPTLDGITIRSCDIERRGKDEARITLVIVADHPKRQAKAVTLIKRTVSRLETYCGYQHWYPNSYQLAVNVSCRDDESLLQAGKDFLVLLFDTIAARLEAEAERARSTKGRSPGTQRRHRQSQPYPAR